MRRPEDIPLVPVFFAPSSPHSWLMNEHVVRAENSHFGALAPDFTSLKLGSATTS